MLPCELSWLPALLSIARSAVPVLILAERCSAASVQNAFQLLQTVTYGPRKRTCGCSVPTVSIRPRSAALVVGAVARSGSAPMVCCSSLLSSTERLVTGGAISSALLATGSVGLGPCTALFRSSENLAVSCRNGVCPLSERVQTSSVGGFLRMVSLSACGSASIAAKVSAVFLNPPA